MSLKRGRQDSSDLNERTMNHGQQNGGGMKRSYGEGNQMTMANYAEAIKVGQRSSQNFKHAWHQYCEANGQMMYDPNKQNVEFIQNFLDQLGRMYTGNMHGAPPPPQFHHQQGYQQKGGQWGGPQPPMGGKGAHAGKGAGASRPPQNQNADPGLQKVIDLVKQGQRNSQEWKNQWIDWCQENGNGVHDPNRHGAIFVIAFVLKFGLAEVVSAQWAGQYLVSLGELAKPYMVGTIKKGQSMSEVWKEQWGLFADSKANGTRDPNRHDAGSLMEFFDTIAMQQFQTESWMVPYVNGSEPTY